VKDIRAWLHDQNIILAGRDSEWEYYSSDHVFLAGKKAADAVRTFAERRLVSGYRGGEAFFRSVR